jgi:hypothetical protein
MLQIEISQAHYVSVPYSDESVISMFGFVRINGINMLKLYLNNRSRQRNSFSIEFTQVPSNSQTTIQASRSISPSRLGCNASRQISV